jgi:hypothetical protein
MAGTWRNGTRVLRRRGTASRRFVNFEPRNQSPKLHLVAVGKPPGVLFRRTVVDAGKADPANELAAFVQNVKQIVRHRLFSIRMASPFRRQFDLD